jgi:ATP-dependent Clp protease ATP-binding subunit ClpA
VSPQPVPFAPETLESIRRAFRLAADRRHDLVSLEHLLAALLEDPQALRLLQACHIDLSTLRHDLDEVLQRAFSLRSAPLVWAPPFSQPEGLRAVARQAASARSARWRRSSSSASPQAAIWDAGVSWSGVIRARPYQG